MTVVPRALVLGATVAAAIAVPIAAIGSAVTDEGDAGARPDGVPVPAAGDLVAHRGGHGGSPNGLGSPSLPGLRMPLGSKAALVATRTSKAGPSASAT